MGTIVERKKRDGTSSFTAQIRKTENGRLIYNATQTFHRRKQAEVWIVQREAEFEKGLLSRPTSVTFAELIDRYLAEYNPDGRTKVMDMKYLRSRPLCSRNVYELTSGDYLEHIKERAQTVKPQTIINDLVWLNEILKAAKIDWGLPVSLQPLIDARDHARRQRWIAHSELRTRRILPDELQSLLDFFAASRHQIPISDIIQFALASARRSEEITLLRWDDLDAEKSIITVRQVKHPQKKAVNDRVSRLTREALAIIQNQARVSEFIFPYNHRSVGDAFTNACKVLGIKNLHFHDLRHEAISRLFERGYAIHEVALFSLHTSWTTLQRYTHLKPEDLVDK